MTDLARFRAAVCISLFLHFMLLQAHWAQTTARPGMGQRLSQELTSSAPMFSETVTLAIESISETLPPGDGADNRRKERNAYLDAVSNAIHARRFISAEANNSLIGMAWFSFTVSPDGTFHGISLANSSGNAILDRAAEAALRGASGVVKRPASLGHNDISLVMAVKYQYGL